MSLIVPVDKISLLKVLLCISAALLVGRFSGNGYRDRDGERGSVPFPIGLKIPALAISVGY